MHGISQPAWKSELTIHLYTPGGKKKTPGHVPQDTSGMTLVWTEYNYLKCIFWNTMIHIV